MFSEEQFIAEVRRLVAEKQDFVYLRPLGSSNCSYVYGRDGCGCLFGQVLQNLGISKEKLLYFENMGIHVVLLKNNIRSKVVKWARIIQGQQDSAISWQKSLEAADIECPLQ